LAIAASAAGSALQISMIQDRTVLAIVPARGGSKGIPLKNLREVAGRSLIAHVGSVIPDVPELDRAVVSTDHPAIAREAEKAGMAAPFLRPEEIAGDFVGDVDVLSHALLATEALDNMTYDIIVMLQPTSPLRKASDVSAAIRMLVEGGWDSVWTVSPSDSKAHPLKQLTITDGTLDYYDRSGAQIIARQQMQPVYQRNGVAYALTRHCLIDQRSIKGRRAGALINDTHHVSIDTEWDIELAELLIARASR
jgi:CMP-N,N'-diacetyllegionaminic acid synthase